MRRHTLPVFGTMLVTALAILSLAGGTPDRGMTVFLPQSLIAVSAPSPGCLPVNAGSTTSGRDCIQARTASR